MIKPCNCVHAFQDERYGQGRRVHNKHKTSTAPYYGWRCTVCGATKTVQVPKEEKKS